MIQIHCRCGREMELVHPPESGVVICSGCLAEVPVPGKLARRRVRTPVPRKEEWLTCRKCRNSFPWPTRYVGRMMRCPVCGKRVWMPNYRRKFRWWDKWDSRHGEVYLLALPPRVLLVIGIFMAIPFLFISFHILRFAFGFLLFISGDR